MRLEKNSTDPKETSPEKTGGDSRRRFFQTAGALSAALLAGACSRGSQSKEPRNTAVEILGMGHGVLRRVLFVLEEAKGGLDARMDVSPEGITGSVEILRKFVIGYHQVVEEQYYYPLFEQAGKMKEIVSVLRAQHKAGKDLVDIMGKMALQPSLKDLDARRTLGLAIHKLSRMYRAHAAWEDTVLNPALFEAADAARIQSLNSEVRKADRSSLGEQGYHEILRMLSQLETSLGIGELSSFTPNLEEFGEE